MHTIKHVIALGVTAVAACGPLTAGIALAQTAQAVKRVEELVVTARKREQNLQEVAVGVSLLSGKALAQAQLQNAADLSTLIPTLNVQASSGPSTSSFNIRGIGTQAFSSAIEPSVSTMLDGVAMGNSGMAFLELVDIERVEVLRGPQGTLYGKNASGGVIHIITRDPTPGFTGTLTATAIEGGEYRIGGTVSGPVAQDLTFRLTGAAVDDDGYGKNRFNGDTLNSAESFNLRGKLLWQPGESLELLWSSDYGEKDCECTALSVRSIMESAVQDALLREQLPVVPSKRNQDVNNDQPTFTNVTASGHSLTLNWDVNDHVLTSISAWRRWENDGIVDLDNRPSNPLALAFPMPPDSDLQQFSQEIRIASPAADWGSYVAGVYYFGQDVDSGNDTSTSLLGPTTTRVTRTEVESENYALFGEASFNVGVDWTATLGARYTQEELEYETLAIGTDNLIFPPEGDIADNIDDSDLSPRAALKWQINDGTMAYVSFTSGYKGPAFDTSIVAAGTSVEPETSEAWELGIKSSLLDNRLLLNLTLFHADYEQFQAQALLDGDPADQLPGSFLLINAGEVSTRGVELELIARPAQDWTLTGGIAYTDGTIEEYPGGNCSAGQKFRGECPGNVQDLSGGQLPYTPKWKLNLSTDYRIPLQNQGASLVLGADLRTRDDTLYEISQDPYTVQDSYTVVDARASLVTDRQLGVTAFVKNLFDENYANLIYAQAEQLIPHGYIHGVPKYANRTFGVELRYDFQPR